MADNNIIQVLNEQKVESQWKPSDQNQNCIALNTNTGDLMKFKYDEHDVTVAFSNTSPDFKDLVVGQTFNFTGSKDNLEITLLKTAMRNGRVKELDFSLRLGKGGLELVFVYVEETHLTVKGHTFAGQSSSHILFQSLLFPLLQRKVLEQQNFVKKEIKVEVKLLEIVDLTQDEDDIKLPNETIEAEATKANVKKERIDVPLIEELDEEQIKVEKVEDLVSVKGKTGPLPSSIAKRLLIPSQELSYLLPTGSSAVTRSEVLKGLWIYIKEQKLQDPFDKNFFTPDVAMQNIFGNERIRGCSMSKYLKKHLATL